MVKEKNLLRHTKADRTRIELFKKKANLLSIFSSKEMKVVFRYLKPYLKGIVFLIVLALGLSFLEGFKALSIIAFIKSFFMESIETFSNFKIFGKYEIAKFLPFKDNLTLSILAIFIVLSLVSILVKLFVSILTRKFQLTLARDLRKDLYNKIVRFDIDFFNEAKSGELLFMMNTEVSRFSNFILYFKNFISSSFTLLIFMAILLYMAPLITLAIVVLAAVFMYFHQKLERRLKIISWQSNFYKNTLQQVFYQIVYGIKLIKLGGLENRERNEYVNHHLEFEREDLRIIKLRSISDAAREGFFILILILFSFAFFYLMNKGIFVRDNSFILSYMFVLVKIIPYFSQFQHSVLNVVESYGPLAKIVDILTRPIEEKKRLEIKSSLDREPIDKIETENLFFSHKGKEDILKDININFSKGKLYAIVGFTGVGKSTLLDLIVNIRAPKAGRILFNGMETEIIDQKVLKNRIGYVNQEPLIFHDSIRENIVFFKDDSTDEKINEVLKMSALKDFVSSLPAGLNTGLGERGMTVSGGERQRIGLARVLLKDPEILLLDEATNSLDYKTEKAIYDNLKRIKDTKIIVVVAHRLSSVVDFDEILVLHEGRLEEKGRHEELMNKRGIYYDLYKLQEAGNNIEQSL